MIQCNGQRSDSSYTASRVQKGRATTGRMSRMSNGRVRREKVMKTARDTREKKLLDAWSPRKQDERRDMSQ